MKEYLGFLGAPKKVGGGCYKIVRSIGFETEVKKQSIPKKLKTIGFGLVK